MHVEKRRLEIVSFWWSSRARLDIALFIDEKKLYSSFELYKGWSQQPKIARSGRWPFPAAAPTRTTRRRNPRRSGRHGKRSASSSVPTTRSGPWPNSTEVAPPNGSSWCRLTPTGSTGRNRSCRSTTRSPTPYGCRSTDLVDPARHIDYHYPAADASFPGIRLDGDGQVLWGLTLRFVGHLFERLGVPFLV